jgi:hypothetical protein
MQANHHGIATDSVYICAGGSATLTAPPGAQYSWNTAATTQSIVVTQPGTYSFMITDPSQPACFSFSNSITVVQAGTIQTPIITQTNNQLEALNVIPAPGISWQWFLNGTPIIGATQNTYVVTSNGCYTVAIYEGSCESTSNEICVTNTSLNELLPGSINIYPHPVINTSFIETPFKEGSFTSLKIKDVNGREVFAKTERQGRQLQLDKGAFRSGVYFLEISNSEYQGTIVRKIIIR